MRALRMTGFEEVARLASIDVRLVDVVKAFGDVAAVDHVSLDVYDGEFFSLLGPSGCGKTTTLRMIGGFEEPTSGLIELQGQDVTWLPPYKRNVNTVFQNYALFPHLSIYENVAFGLRRQKVKAAEIKKRVAEMLELVQLPGFDNRKPGQISGGQAQRVALARALINRPAVLLLDEPLGALDLKLRKQMQIELKRIQSEVGITFIYVTHDQEEAMTMSNRIAVMNRGRYEQLGSPEELYERPQTRFVAGFLGASNLIPGTVVDRGGSWASVRTGDGTVLRVARSMVDGVDEVEVGVRPEKIRIADSASTAEADAEGASSADAVSTYPPRNMLAGSIRSTAYTGVSTQYQVVLDYGREVQVYEQNLERALGARHRAIGDRVRLSWAPEDTFAVAASDASGGSTSASPSEATSAVTGSEPAGSEPATAASAGATSATG
jgi:spermidine/putrescine transport system ATP-binding protein